MLPVGLAVAGLSVLTVCAIRVYAGVRALGREINRTTTRLAASQERMETEVKPRE